MFLVCSLLSLAGLTTVLLVGSGNGSGQKVHAVADSVNVNINSGAGAGCNSDGAVTKCGVLSGSSFTVNFAITVLPSEGSYGGYDLKMGRLVVGSGRVSFGWRQDWIARL